VIVYPFFTPRVAALQAPASFFRLLIHVFSTGGTQTFSQQFVFLFVPHPPSALPALITFFWWEHPGPHG